MALAWGALLGVAAAASYEPFCEDASGERRACVEQWVSAHPPTPQSLKLLTERLDTDPSFVAETTALYGVDGYGAFPSSLAAELLDLRSTALARSGDDAGAAATAALAVRHDDGARRLTWMRPGGKPGWTASVDAGKGRLHVAARRMLDVGREADARPLLTRAINLGAAEAVELWRVAYPDAAIGVDWPGRPLRQVTWGPSIPDLAVPLHDGRTFRLRGEGVLLIDFWASWCYPCQLELPALSALYEAQKDAGLRAVAVNVDEPKEVALSAAEEMGVTVPIGEYTPPLAGAFRVENLPTVIVADRHGKVRRRWSGYRDGIEQDVSETVRNLLYQEEDAGVVELASVLRADLPIEVSWVRKGPRAVQAVAVLPKSENEPGAIVVASLDDLALLEGDGAGRAQYELPFDANELRPLQDTGEGVRVAAFRRGSDRVFFLRPRDGETWSGSAPAAVFDLRAAPSRGATAVLLATLGGPVVWDGDTTQPFDSPDRALAAVEPAGDRLWAVLDGGGSVVWLDRALTAPERSAPVPRASELVAAPSVEGVGVLPVGLLSAAAGRAGTVEWIAVVAPGQLVVLDARAGTELFRAVWPDISAVAAGDLDGDGRDDLVVGSGAQISLLRISTGEDPE